VIKPNLRREPRSALTSPNGARGDARDSGDMGARGELLLPPASSLQSYSLLTPASVQWWAMGGKVDSFSDMHTRPVRGTWELLP
jgi:hypothetical protein